MSLTSGIVVEQEASTSSNEALGETEGGSTVSARHRLRRWLLRRVIRAGMAVHRIAMILATPMGRLVRRRGRRETFEVLLTGTFYSDNWVNAHVRPLAASKNCACVRVVSTWPVPPTPKVVAVYPPTWLKSIVGAVPARLLLFCWMAIRLRPDIVGGFHLLVNGLVVSVMARLVGAKSMYFCVGGPKEVVGGGIEAENRLFGKMQTADSVVEHRLIKAVGMFDIVVTMGTGAVGFFRSHGLRNAFHVVSGGIAGAGYSPGDQAPATDLILVARLAPIKRIDVFLASIKLATAHIPHMRATIVGDGELRRGLGRMACELGIDHCVSFVGHQRDVAEWLRRARLFVLTSDSEGLALSLMEAMMCGLPAVVSNVGDLGDLVEDGVNGYLVERRRPEAFAERIVELLADEAKRTAFSQAARRAALRYDIPNVTRQWDEILAECNGHAA